MMRLCWTVLIGVAASAVALAQTGEPDVPVTALPLSPAAAPEPALRYRLLPELRDTHPGNAALLYYRAFAPEWWGFYRRGPKYAEALDEAQKWPLEKLRHLSESDAALVGWVRGSHMLHEVDRAARRSFIDWEMTDRVREDGIGLLLPDVQSMREFARMLAVRARLELADGQFEKAAYTFQTGLQMGRHVSDAPTLIQSLVGAAITAVTLDQVEEWTRTPGSPNLYWALTGLPQPYIDLRKPMDGERLMFDNLMPGMREALADPGAAALSPDQLNAMVSKVAAALESPQAPRLLIAAWVAKMYGPAKEYLRRHGRTAEQVEALPALQAVLMVEVAKYDHMFDAFQKAQALPYWQARPLLEGAERQLKEGVARAGGPGLYGLAGLLLPAVIKVQFASARTDRKINALRTVEAIRLYAAAHGKLPENLDALEVPVPTDPVTGRPFEYRMEGGTARLTGPTPAGERPHEGNTLRYEITLRR
jgi:hypothetical protein